MLVVDTHETNSSIPIHLDKMKVPFEIKHLAVADYAINDIGIERKTESDFIHSITKKNKRLWKQLLDLRNNYAKPLLIIEKSKKLYSSFNPIAFRRTLVVVSVSYNIPVLHTNSKKETAELLKYLHDKYYNPKKKEYIKHTEKSKLNRTEQQEYIISAFPGVGTSTAKKLLFNFGSVENIIKASKEKIMEVKGVGKKTAENIFYFSRIEY